VLRTSSQGNGNRLSGSLKAVRNAATLFVVAFFALGSFPSVAFAQKTLTNFINTATEVVGLAIPFALLLLLFFWSMMQLVMTTGDAEKKKQAKQRIIWGIIAIFVIFSLGGLIAAIQQTFFSDSLTLP